MLLYPHPSPEGIMSEAPALKPGLLFYIDALSFSQGIQRISINFSHIFRFTDQ